MPGFYSNDASRVSVSIDGSKGQFVTKVSGGMQVKLEKVAMANAAGKFGQFTVTSPKTEEITFEMGAAHAGPWLDWANLFIDSNHQPKDLEILYGNSFNDVTGGVTATGCLMTSFSMAALDGSGKDALKFTMKVRPAQIAAIKPGGKMDAIQETKQKDYMVNAFRLELDPLPMEGCKKIDALTWAMKVKELQTGSSRFAQIAPTIVDLPELSITCDTALGDSLSKVEDWFNDFAEKGNNGSGKELSGAITLLGSDNIKELFAIEFKQFGAYEFKRADREANKDGLGEYTLKGYAETWDLRKI
jgi:hypothetical protein